MLLQIWIPDFWPLEFLGVFLLDEPLLTDFHGGQTTTNAVSAHLAAIDANNCGGFVRSHVARNR